MDKPYRFDSGGMSKGEAFDVADRIEAMGFPATIRSDDYGQFQVTVETPEEKQILKSFRAYENWYREWCDTHHSGGGGTVRIFEPDREPKIDHNW